MRNVNRVITVVLAVIAAGLWFLLIWPTMSGGWVVVSYDPGVAVPAAITLSLAACFGWLLLWLSVWRRDRETRCRACGYILRGLSEPRCPECGERI